jgi:hypothetical protein
MQFSDYFRITFRFVTSYSCFEAITWYILWVIWLFINVYYLFPLYLNMLLRLVKLLLHYGWFRVQVLVRRGVLVVQDLIYVKGINLSIGIFDFLYADFWYLFLAIKSFYLRELCIGNSWTELSNLIGLQCIVEGKRILSSGYLLWIFDILFGHKALYIVQLTLDNFWI